MLLHAILNRPPLAIRAFVFSLTVALASHASAQTTTTYSEYTAKFLCGTANSGFANTIAAGVYSTSINVHNPNMFANQAPLSFLKKAVIAKGEGSTFTPPSSFQTDTLPNDYAENINCGTIRALLGSAAPPLPNFFEGFVVIIVPPASSPNQLDVTGVYSSSNNGPITLDVVPVATRIVTPPAAGAIVEGSVQ